MKNPLRLLAVDDDIDSAELIVRVAERCGFEGFATSDSRGVLNLATALKPDVLSVDICMPNIDANELLAMCSKKEFTGKIMIVSGQEQAVLLETKAYGESLGLDMCHYQQKPLDFRVLRQFFSEITAMQEAA